MSSDQPPRQLSSEQLTSAEETFPGIKVVVVKQEEEVGQYRLLDFTRIPLIILHRTDANQNSDDCHIVDSSDGEDQNGCPATASTSTASMVNTDMVSAEKGKSKAFGGLKDSKKQKSGIDPAWEGDSQWKQTTTREADSVQHHVKMEEDDTDRQLYYQDPPETGQIKEEHDELEHLQIKQEISISMDEDQLVLKQETDTFIVTPYTEEIQHTELTPNNSQLISLDAAEAETQTLERSDPGASGSTGGNGGHKTIDHEDIKKQNKTKKTQKHKLYLCKMCEENLSQNGLLTKKIKNHRDKKCVSCENCGKTFGPNTHVSQYLITYTGDKPFSCKICGKSFSRKPYLNNHKKVHTGERPFSCKLCGKCFSYKNVLNTHMKVHTSEKPFSCKICGKSFSYKNVLNTHMIVHTDEKPFTCKLCGKSFSFKNVLATHMKVHTGEKPFSCELCGKRFGHKANLSRHMKVHTGEKPFSCKLCGKSFSQKTHLSDHMKVHADDKAFLCTICGKISVIKHCTAS